MGRRTRWAIRRLEYENRLAPDAVAYQVYGRVVTAVWGERRRPVVVVARPVLMAVQRQLNAAVDRGTFAVAPMDAADVTEPDVVYRLTFRE